MRNTVFCRANAPASISSDDEELPGSLANVRGHAVTREGLALRMDCLVRAWWYASMIPDTLRGYRDGRASSLHKDSLDCRSTCSSRSLGSLAKRARAIMHETDNCSARAGHNGSASPGNDLSALHRIPTNGGDSLLDFLRRLHTARTPRQIVNDNVAWCLSSVPWARDTFNAMTAYYSTSVVIPTYQRCASVLRVLEALTHQTLPPDEYEVIVSIDGSTDGTRAAVERFSALYRIHALWQPNCGRAAACNAGMRAATGGVVILLDDDMEPLPGFLLAHRQCHPHGSRLGIMGAVPITHDRSTAPVTQYIGRKFNAHLEKLASPDYDLKLRDFYSGNFSIRHAVLLEVGGFDEGFRIYGNEDLELSIRLKEAGVHLRYSAEAAARQHYTKGFAALARDNIAKGRTAVLLAEKHPESFADLRLSAYHQAPRTWRLLRAGLIAASARWGRTPTLVIACIEWLAKRRPPWLHRCYDVALDYFFWVGARAAMREHADASHALAVPREAARRSGQ